MLEEKLQSYCYWCNDPIYAQSVYNVKYFWNQQWEGYPICDICSKGLKTDGKPLRNKLRKELGLYEPQQSMEAFL